MRAMDGEQVAAVAMESWSKPSKPLKGSRKSPNTNKNHLKVELPKHDRLYLLQRALCFDSAS